MIESVTTANRNDLVERYVNGRVEIERRNQTYGKLNLGQLATEAPNMISNHPEQYCHGKTLLRRLREEFRVRYSVTLQDAKPTPHLRNDTLSIVSSKVFRKHDKVSPS